MNGVGRTKLDVVCSKIKDEWAFVFWHNEPDGNKCRGLRMWNRHLHPTFCINLATPLPARSTAINLLVAASFKHKVSKVDRPHLKILFKS